MSTYLQDHPPRRSQCRWERRQTPTGLTVVHTAESALDVIAPDTGAENVARYIATRTDPGSYHDLVDSDSALQLLPYDAEAYQDGTGSNPYALSISFACRGSDWPRMATARRDAFLKHGASAFGRQQAWLAEHDYPATPLRRITRSESARGLPGFISHGDRDPWRRTDPGPGFPWERFFELCSYVVAQPPPDDPSYPSEDDVDLYRDTRPGAEHPQDVVAFSPLGRRRLETLEEVAYWQASGRAPAAVRLLADDLRLAKQVDRLPWLEATR